MWNRLINHLRWRWRMWQHIYAPQCWYALFLPGTVQSGPFKGLKYGRLATGSVVLPKLIGTYEAELHPTLESWDISQYDLCVDVGAGEGYYAAGLCYRFPDIRMIAFEQSATGRRRIRQLAQRNDVVSRIQVLPRCEPPDLQHALTQGRKPLLIMDVEGYEAVLMDLHMVPALSGADFIVEMHPEHLGDNENALQQRFAQTHRIDFINQIPGKKLPPGVQLPNWLSKKSDFLTNEFRGPQYWITGQSIQRHPSW